MKYAPQALFALTVLLIGCASQSGRFHKYVVVSPPVLIASTPAPLASDDTLTAAAGLVKRAMDSLPSWEKDGLSRFEQPELAAVKADIKACQSATDNDTFLKDVEQLKIDAGLLVELDNRMSREWLL
jgi:hypothetical protein